MDVKAPGLTREVHSKLPDLSKEEGRGIPGVVVKSLCSTEKLPLKLCVLSTFEAGGMCHVEVKFLDMTQNTNCEGSSLNCN